jgi:hypothetical protein
MATRLTTRKRDGKAREVAGTEAMLAAVRIDGDATHVSPTGWIRQPTRETYGGPAANQGSAVKEGRDDYSGTDSTGTGGTRRQLISEESSLRKPKRGRIFGFARRISPNILAFVAGISVLLRKSHEVNSVI